MDFSRNSYFLNSRLFCINTLFHQFFGNGKFRFMQKFLKNQNFIKAGFILMELLNFGPEYRIEIQALNLHLTGKKNIHAIF